MAQEGEQQPKVTDKGKGKAVDGESKEDAKLVINGQKSEGVVGATEELSEEDQQLKNELDMMVERLTVCSVTQFVSLHYLT